MIPGAEFRRLFESEPAIRNMTVQAFSSVVFRLMAELEEIHSYKLDRRLANFLVRHASTEGKVQMTLQEIASHLGTTREVIARLFRQLTSEGHIRSGRNQIVLNDPVRLAESSGVRPRQGKRSLTARYSTRRRTAAAELGRSAAKPKIGATMRSSTNPGSTLLRPICDASPKRSGVT